MMFRVGRVLDSFVQLRSCSGTAVRVRFAPSPTGFLHLGGLRTALYNYLFAKLHKGKFILRIEDTDQTRLVSGAASQLQTDLEWSGIEIHEGPTNSGKHGPYIQSERLNIYKEHVKILLDNQSAYHCFCTDKRLQLLRREAIRAQETPKYDNRCRNLSREETERRIAKGDPSCIRFKISSEEEVFNDLIYGEIRYNISLSEGDPVIVKSDGYPTYHFANVVDDHLMQISHVLRGVEWQISTTKHLLLYRAFQWKPPLFGHLPLLMNADNTKLSKRQGDIQIAHYRNSNIFPLALINFIVHSGGGFEKDLIQSCAPRIYSVEELANQFDLSRINTHSGRLMPERLLEFNRLELKRKLSDKIDAANLVDELKGLIREKYPAKLLNIEDDYVRTILNWSVNRIEKLSDLLSDKFEFVWNVPDKTTLSHSEKKAIELFAINFQTADLDRDNLNSCLKASSKEGDLKFAAFMKIMRKVLTGLQEGPGVAEIIEILGKETTLKRLELSLNDKS